MRAQAAGIRQELAWSGTTFSRMSFRGSRDSPWIWRRGEHTSHRREFLLLTLHDATDLNFQGLACMYKGAAAEHLTQARGFFERALAIDPRSIRVLIGVASVELNMAGNLLTDDRPARLSPPKQMQSEHFH